MTAITSPVLSAAQLATLRQHGEAADRDKGDEQHPEHKGRERDRLGVERIRLGD